MTAERSTSPTNNNTLWFGDNLEILRSFPADMVDLIYLDPPFNSKANYNILFKTPADVKSESQILAFEDTWHWGTTSESYYDMLLKTSAAPMIEGLRHVLGKNDMTAYLMMMSVRLVELHRVLKQTGSICLHCDPVASHYLKAVMDAVFDVKNFRNEIIWKRTNSTKEQTKVFGRQHDILLWFSKSDQYTYHKTSKRLEDKQPSSAFSSDDKDGRGPYQTIAIIAGGIQRSPNRRVFEFKGVKEQWLYKIETLEQWWKDGLIVKTSGGKYRKKDYWSDKVRRGDAVSDIWNDADVAPIQSNERLGYPTQKPQALLERIIKASSNEGDIVLDPFCGCGTTIEAAQKLNRRWIGIDITHLAISLIEKRMRDAFDIRVKVKGVPQDVEGAKELAVRNKLQFEHWAVTRIPNIIPNKKQVGDRGVDGRGYIRLGKQTIQVIASVKGGYNVNPSMVRDLGGTMDAEHADMGVLILLAKPTRKMVEAAAKYGLFQTPLNEYPKLQIWTIQQYFSGVLPRLPSLADYSKAPRSRMAYDGIMQTTL